MKAARARARVRVRVGVGVGAGVGARDCFRPLSKLGLSTFMPMAYSFYFTASTVSTALCRPRAAGPGGQAL